MTAATIFAFLAVNRLGRLAPGYRVDVVGFEPDSMDVIGTLVAGRPRALETGRAVGPARRICLVIGALIAYFVELPQTT